MKAGLFIILLLHVSGILAQSQKPNYREQSRKLLREKKIQAAEIYGDSSLAEALQTNNPDSIEAAYLWLYEIHFTDKNFEKAISDFKMASIYRDSTITRKHRLVEANLNGALQAAREDNEKTVASFQEKLKQIQAGDREMGKNSMIILWGMILFFGVAMFALYRLRLQTINKLKVAQSELHELKAFKERLFTILSYDLKNSLVSFENLSRGLASQLKGFSKEESILLLDKLRLTASDLNVAINNLIHWVAYQVQSKPFQPELFDSKDLLEHLVERFRPHLSDKRLEATIFIPDRQPVFADKEMIAIVIENLILNAIQYTPPGGVITCFSGRKDGVVTLGVKDTGVGIAEEKVATLFNIQSEVPIRSNQVHHGSGVGLLLCKDLVERNGGRIYVESTVGLGSTFYFTLPPGAVA